MSVPSVFFFYAYIYFFYLFRIRTLNSAAKYRLNFLEKMHLTDVTRRFVYAFALCFATVAAGYFGCTFCCGIDKCSRWLYAMHFKLDDSQCAHFDCRSRNGLYIVLWRIWYLKSVVYGVLKVEVQVVYGRLYRVAGVWGLRVPVFFSSKRICC